MRSQYGNKPVKYYESKGRNIRFESDAEQWRADVLELLLIGGEILDWDYQPPHFTYPYELEGDEMKGRYKPDFRVWYRTEGGGVRSEYEEVKRDNLSPKYANKILNACLHNPKLKLRLIWYGSKPNPRTRTGKPKWNQLRKLEHVLVAMQFERAPK